MSMICNTRTVTNMNMDMDMDMDMPIIPDNAPLTAAALPAV
jgi:hypothetical protein